MAKRSRSEKKRRSRKNSASSSKDNNQAQEERPAVGVVPTEVPTDPRTRQRGTGYQCQIKGCHGDLFVTHTRKSPYPGFMKRPGIRYYKCGACQNTTKRAIPYHSMA